VSVCLGTACFVKGADLVLEAFKNELGIDLGETTSDGLFSLEATRCIGVCALAPVVTINEEVFSRVKPSQVTEGLNKLKSKMMQEMAENPD
jgi:NADH:ubiquinone oxidoreductase subunit E